MIIKKLRLAVCTFSNVRATFRRYENGNLALQLTDNKTGEPIAVASVNPPNAILPKDCIAIKDWSENAGMVEALVDAKIIEEFPYGGEPSGFVCINFYKLHPDRITDLRASGLLKELTT